MNRLGGGPSSSFLFQVNEEVVFFSFKVSLYKSLLDELKLLGVIIREMEFEIVTQLCLYFGFLAFMEVPAVVRALQSEALSGDRPSQCPGTQEPSAPVSFAEAHRDWANSAHSLVTCITGPEGQAAVTCCLLEMVSEIFRCSWSLLKRG